MSVRYYVQMSATPPKVFFKHPIDMVPANMRASAPAPMNDTQIPRSKTVVPPIQTQDPSQSAGKLTFAQQLYASSMRTSLSPMINSQSVPTSQQPPLYIKHLPTPPPPPPGHLSANFNLFPSIAPPLLNPYLTNTRTLTPPINSHPHHRLSNMSQRSVYDNPSTAGSQPTRHLITMARPPDEQSSFLLSPLVLEPPAAVHSAPVPSPLPASSILFSQTSVTSPITPPLSAVQSTPMTPPNMSSLFSVPSGTAYKAQNISPLDRVSGLADGVASALQSALLTPGSGVDQMSLQAVIQGRPDADYQRIINALIKLHQHQQQHQQFAMMKLQMQQTPPVIDYRALIAEVRKAQQQHTLQSFQGRQQPQTAAQQYQALVEQQYQQKAAIQQQQQQAAQYQALLQQQKGTQSAIQPNLEAQAHNVYSTLTGGNGLVSENHSGGNRGQDFSGVLIS